ncbi:MAG: NlpC/P60 family protein [Atopobiaceae bacterium]|nr:NlpC/P60 family protein [Atopobiaceae bacterium]
MGVGAPAALAEPSTDDLASAQSQLESLGSELSSLQDQLSTATDDVEQTDYEISQANSQISDTQTQLDAARSKLGDRISSSYKSGSTNMLDILLGSDSISDLISRVYYMDKVSEQDADTISQVEDLQTQLSQQKASLEQKQADQQQAVSDMQSQVDDYQSKVSSAQSYYDSLDSDVQAQVTAEEGTNANVAAAVNAVTGGTTDADTTADQGGDATESAGGTTTTGGGTSSSSNSGSSSSGSSSSGSSSSGSSSSSSGSSSSGSSSSGSTYSGGGVSSAYGCIGKPYVYGATGPNSFDCSGLVCYCFGYGRGRTTYDMIASLQASGDWKTSKSELSVGDLVFPSSGHVGIYIGNNQMIHAPYPGRTVCITSVYSFIGGGTY